MTTTDTGADDVGKRPKNKVTPFEGLNNESQQDDVTIDNRIGDNTRNI